MGISSPGEKPHGSSSRHRGKKGAYGQIQLQICHDPKANILYVTVIKARLPKQRRVSGAGGPGEEGGEIVVAENPYVTVFLLPERVLENQRRTRHVANVTLTPTWNQTMVYPNVTGEDLKDKYLEVAVRNYNPEGGVDALLGKIILYLSGTCCCGFVGWGFLFVQKMETKHLNFLKSIFCNMRINSVK